MRRVLGPIALAMVLVAGGCSAFHGRMTPAPMAPAPVVADGAVVETIPFRTGVSSATVENLAKQQGCTGGQGAALVTEPGPAEVYRMRCSSDPASGAMHGQVFMARCELRQCKRM
jgi:hypothetical protein